MEESRECLTCTKTELTKEQELFIQEQMNHLMDMDKEIFSSKTLDILESCLKEFVLDNKMRIEIADQLMELANEAGESGYINGFRDGTRVYRIIATM